MRSIDEFRAERASAAVPLSKEHLDGFKAIAQERVRIAALTGREEWDHFLRYLEARIQVCEAAIVDAKDKLASPMLVEQTAILQQKMALAGLEASRRTLEEVIALPKWLVEQGERAWAVVLAEEKNPE